MKIFLIADDSDAKALWLEAMVKKSGFAGTVMRARNTDDAKELIDEHLPEAAFIDYEMPSENGPAVIAYLREKVPQAKIAMASSSNSDRYQAEAQEAGSDAYICTSFAEEEVVTSVMHTLLEWQNS
ncbi:MAG: response regulator [bacterium]|nr:response regulator [bacterium]